jgi:hypothetical protein
MKKILFVCSHLHSGSSILCRILNDHPKIQLSEQVRSNYSSAESLMALSKQHHKLDNRSAIYMDELLYNYQLSTTMAYKECKFIYIVREPDMAISELVARKKMHLPFAIRYYTYRLRRLCEMAKRTPNAVLLTRSDLDDGKGMNLIEDYLNLKIPIQPSQEQFKKEKRFTGLIGHNHLLEVEETFQRYLYYLKNQNLRQL